MVIQKLHKQPHKLNIDQLNVQDEKFTFLNPVSYLTARQQAETYNEFSQLLADGWLFVLALRCIGIKAERYSFDMTSLAPIVFNQAIKRNKSVYFIGSKPEEIESFVSVIQNHFPELKICGYQHGYFNNTYERKTAINQIIENSPDIVVAGLGAPLQEQFIVDLQKAGWKGCGYTCGGFIHQTSKQLNYYPQWVNKLHLRMPYRFFMEPHFRKRLPDYARFLFVFVYDYYKYNTLKKRPNSQNKEEADVTGRPFISLTGREN